MPKHGKKYVEAAKKVDSNKLYSVEDAIKLVKETSYANFDASVEVSYNLSVDPKQADQQIRGSIVLPNGTGKSVKVIVFAEGPQADAAKEVGDGEVAVMRCAVIPDVPDKERIDGLGILPQVFFHVKDAVIIERHGHAHLMERGGIALHVLNGIGIGVEDIGIVDDRARGFGLALYEVVIVSVDTGDHALSCFSGEQPHEHGFLAAFEMLHP